jgi:hypothetical protein
MDEATHTSCARALPQDSTRAHAEDDVVVIADTGNTDAVREAHHRDDNDDNHRRRRQHDGNDNPPTLFTLVASNSTTDETPRRSPPERTAFCFLRINRRRGN